MCNGPSVISNVIKLPKRPSIAELQRIVMSRSRKAALPLLMNRIRELRDGNRPALADAICGDQVPTWSVITGSSLDSILRIDFCRMGDGSRPSIYSDGPCRGALCNWS
jgi:hypothetical protein